MDKRAPKTFKIEMRTKVDHIATRILWVVVRDLVDRDGLFPEGGWSETPNPDAVLCIGGTLEYTAEYLSSPVFLKYGDDPCPCLFANGDRFGTLDDAILTTLSYLLQTRDDLMEGDLFEFSDHMGKDSHFIVTGSHVAQTSSINPSTLERLLAGRVLT